MVDRECANRGSLNRKLHGNPVPSLNVRRCNDYRKCYGMSRVHLLLIRKWKW